MKTKRNDTLENLLDLDGVRYVIDDALGLWVKFQAKKVLISIRKQGVKYSLSLHNQLHQIWAVAVNSNVER